MRKLYRLTSKTNRRYLVLALNEEDAFSFINKTHKNVKIMHVHEAESTFTQYRKESFEEMSACLFTGMAACIHNGNTYQWFVDSGNEEWRGTWRYFV